MPVQISANFPVQYKQFNSAFNEWYRQVCNKASVNGFYILKTSLPVKRKYRIDKSGTLYIGNGSVAGKAQRIKQFVACLNALNAEHFAGVLYHGKGYKKEYPLQTLSLYIELTSSHKVTACKFMEEYIEKFGEPPLLNT